MILALLSGAALCAAPAASVTGAVDGYRAALRQRDPDAMERITSADFAVFGQAGTLLNGPGDVAAGIAECPETGCVAVAKFRARNREIRRDGVSQIEESVFSDRTRETVKAIYTVTDGCITRLDYPELKASR